MLVPSTVLARAKANVAAIEVLRRLEAENRPATHEEQAILARWSGWGAVPHIFADNPSHEFAPLHDKLRELLSDDEWAAAKGNSLNAHYTDPAMAQAIWDGLRQLGFDGGEVLEPGAGSGNFIGHAPDGVHVTGVELDPITAGITKALYPHADIRAENFKDTRLPDGMFDATVGNVPFGDYQEVDFRHNKGNHNIHNHFILKSLDLTRPGGLVAVITSRFTMDGSGSRAEDARMEMASKGELVGAVRLPGGAHRRTAGTDVVTDLLVFRRRDKDKEFTSGRDRTGAVKPLTQRSADDPPMWVHTARVTDLPGQDPEKADDPQTPKVHVNPYFLVNPERVLGQMSVGHGMYGPGDLNVDGNRNAAPDLHRVLGHIASDAKADGLAYRPDSATRVKPRLLEPGSDRQDGHVQFEADGTFTQVRDGQVLPYHVPKTQFEEARQLVGLRDAMKDLVRAENDPAVSDAEVERLRHVLNDAYQAYHGKFGSLNRFEWSKRKATDPETGETVEKATRKRPPMGGLLTKDPTMAVVLGLDSYDENTKTSTPAAIFTKRQGRHRAIAEHADTPEDALVLSLETHGRLDVDDVARALRTTPEDARRQLLAARSTDPETGEEMPLVFQDHGGPDLVPAADYLSGNVRQKLNDARARAADDPEFEVNVRHLEDVIPPDISPGEIDAAMGASWLGKEPVEQFLQSILGNQVKVDYQGSSMWKVEAPDRVKRSERATSLWGTDDYDAVKLAEAILTNGRIQVRRKDDDGNSYVDAEATQLAQDKAEEMRERFQDWLFQDAARSAQVAKLYNDTHNNLALRSYDGQRRTLPGLVEHFKPHAHQHAAVARMVNEPAALLAHEVGAGKTAEMAMGVMELRRLGLVNKPVIVVPGHMLQQFRDEFQEIYPEAKLLAAGSDDLAGRKRRQFVARTATGDYDAIIMTQTAFESIDMRPEAQRAYMEREIESLERAMARQKAAEDADGRGRNKSDTRMVKEIENRIKKLRAKIEKKTGASKDKAGLSFEDTGIDYVVVDEAHHYKNLATNSSIPGAGIEGSNRASDLDMKLEYLRGKTKSGRVVTFATATPISNSVTEAHTMLRYLRPDLLEAARVRDFDEFASTFGKIVTGSELAPDGSGFREVARFAAFRNMPELLRIWKTVADVKDSDDLADYVDTPDVVGGKAITITVEPTQAQLDYQSELERRARDVKAGHVDPSEDNMLKISSDGRKVSLDPRMVGLEEAGNKLSAAADQIAKIHEQTKDTQYPVSAKDNTPHPTRGGLQIVFMDMGTPKDPSRKKKAKKGADGPTSVEEMEQGQFPAYEELKAQLIARGIPAEKIRFIHEAKNDAEKARLFHDARTGKIAVLVGSTTKMGTGTNVQLRATALHHLDCPWRPADLEQRNGRIIRQGNINPEVAIYQYVTEQSFDGFSWQTVARKAKFIRQLMKGNLTDRTVEDIPDGVFNADQVTALATGNPYLLEKATLKASLGTLERKAKAYMRAQEGYKNTVQAFDKLQTVAQGHMQTWQAALAKRKSTRGDDFNASIGGKDITDRKDALAALVAKAQDVFTDGKRDPYRNDHPAVKVGQVGGLDVTMKFRVSFANGTVQHVVDVELPDVPGSRNGYTLSQIDNPVMVRRIEEGVNGIEGRIRNTESMLRTEGQTANQARERIGKPFEQEADLESARERYNLVNALIREQGKDTTTEEARKAKLERLRSLEAQLKDARVRAGENEDDADDPTVAQDTDLTPRTPAPPVVESDDKGATRIVWPDAVAKKERRAKEKEERARARQLSGRRSKTNGDRIVLDSSKVQDEIDALDDEKTTPESTPAEPRPQASGGGSSGGSKPPRTTTSSPNAGDGDGAGYTPDDAPGETGGQDELTPEKVQSEIDALGDDAPETPEATGETAPKAKPADQVEVNPDEVQSELDALKDDAPETSEAPAPEQTPEATDFKVGNEVMTPHGPGQVFSIDQDKGTAVVNHGPGTNATGGYAIHELRDLGLPGSEPKVPLKQQERDRKAQERAEKDAATDAADLEQATSSEGLALPSGGRLKDVDTEAGHGTVVDDDGNELGWIRASDDGRTWRAQDARGGAPYGPFGGDGRPVRAMADAADAVVSGSKKPADSRDRPRNGPLKPEQMTGLQVWYSALSTRQKDELDALSKEWRRSDDPVLARAADRKYGDITVAEMRRLAQEVDRAAEAVDASTPEGRRRKKVLQGLAAKLHGHADSGEDAKTMLPRPDKATPDTKRPAPAAEDDLIPEDGGPGPAEFLAGRFPLGETVTTPDGRTGKAVSTTGTTRRPGKVVVQFGDKSTADYTPDELTISDPARRLAAESRRREWAKLIKLRNEQTRLMVDLDKGDDETKRQRLAEVEQQIRELLDRAPTNDRLDGHALGDEVSTPGGRGRITYLESRRGGDGHFATVDLGGREATYPTDQLDAEQAPTSPQRPVGPGEDPYRVGMPDDISGLDRDQLAKLYSNVRGRIEGDDVNRYDEHRNDPEYLPTLRRYMQELRDAYQAHDAAGPDTEWDRVRADVAQAREELEAATRQAFGRKKPPSTLGRLLRDLADDSIQHGSSGDTLEGRQQLLYMDGTPSTSLEWDEYTPEQRAIMLGPLARLHKVLKDHTEQLDRHEATFRPRPAGVSIAEHETLQPGFREQQEARPGRVIGGRFQFQQPVTDPEGHGWYVYADGDEDGTVVVGRGPARATFRADELTPETAPGEQVTPSPEQVAQDMASTATPETEAERLGLSRAWAAADFQPGDQVRYQNVIGGRGGHSEGTFARVEDDGKWTLTEPGTGREYQIDPAGVVARVRDGAELRDPEGEETRPEPAQAPTAPAKAPSAMSNEEIAAELMAMDERRFTEGELSGADKTRMAVLEAERDRRAGRKPAAPAKPKPAAAGDSGLFGAPAKPKDQRPEQIAQKPVDQFGTPDMFADAEGAEQMEAAPEYRPAADIKPGDRFVDADGNVIQAGDAPDAVVRTGRGKVRVTGTDGRQHFYDPKAHVREAVDSDGEPGGPVTPQETAPESQAAPQAPSVPEAPGVPETQNSADNPPSIELPEGQRWVHRNDLRPGDVARLFRRGENDGTADLITYTAVPDSLHFASFDNRNRLNRGSATTWQHYDPWVAVVDKGAARTAANRHLKSAAHRHTREDIAENLQRWEERRANPHKPREVQFAGRKWQHVQRETADGVFEHDIFDGSRKLGTVTGNDKAYTWRSEDGATGGTYPSWQSAADGLVRGTVGPNDEDPAKLHRWGLMSKEELEAYTNSTVPEGWERVPLSEARPGDTVRIAHAKDAYHWRAVGVGWHDREYRVARVDTWSDGTPRLVVEDPEAPGGERVKQLRREESKIGLIRPASSEHAPQASPQAPAAPATPEPITPKDAVPVANPNAAAEWERATPRPSADITVTRQGNNVLVSSSAPDVELNTWLKSKKFSWNPASRSWESNKGGWRTKGNVTRTTDGIERDVRAYVAERDQQWEAEKAQIGKTLTPELREQYEREAAAVETYPPTGQQRDVLDSGMNGENLAVVAYAGTGKTSTLVMLARRLRNRRITYLAFNNANSVDAKKKFAGMRHVSVSTAHSLAGRDLAVTPLADKVKEGKADGGIGERADSVWADFLGVRSAAGMDGSIDREDIVALVKEAIRRYRNSDDDEISGKHVPSDEHPTLQQARDPKALRDAVVKYARAAWADKIDPRSRKLHFSHDDYLKIWALSRPKIAADTIFFDEAQDINPVLRRVVMDNMRPPHGGPGAQVVIVGDPNQAIYAFRGAENALDGWPADRTLPLSKSWRFGPEVADIANVFLKLLGATHLMEGNDNATTAIGPIDQPNAVLGRTNAGVVAAVMKALGEGRKVHMVGGGSELKRMAEGARELQNGQRTKKHPDLAPFKSWDDVRKYAEKTDGAQQLAAFVRLVDENGADDLIDMVDRLEEDPKRADLVVSTAHKSKGLEWDLVQIGTDFTGPKESTDPSAPVQLPSDEELRLAYVAATRGMKGVDLGSLEYIEELRGLADERFAARQREMPGNAPEVDAPNTVEVAPEKVQAELDALKDTEEQPHHLIHGQEVEFTPEGGAGTQTGHVVLDRGYGDVVVRDADGHDHGIGRGDVRPTGSIGTVPEADWAKDLPEGSTVTRVGELEPGQIVRRVVRGDTGGDHTVFSDPLIITRRKDGIGREDEGSPEESDVEAVNLATGQIWHNPHARRELEFVRDDSPAARRQAEEAMAGFAGRQAEAHRLADEQDAIDAELTARGEELPVTRTFNTIPDGFTRVDGATADLQPGQWVLYRDDYMSTRHKPVYHEARVGYRSSSSEVLFSPDRGERNHRAHHAFRPDQVVAVRDDQGANTAPEPQTPAAPEAPSDGVPVEERFNSYPKKGWVRLNRRLIDLPEGERVLVEWPKNTVMASPGRYMAVRVGPRNHYGYTVLGGNGGEHAFLSRWVIAVPEGSPLAGDHTPETPEAHTSLAAPEPIQGRASEHVDAGSLKHGDLVRAVGKGPSGATVTREGYLLAEPVKATSIRNEGRERVPVWRLVVGDRPDMDPSDGRRIALDRGATVERAVSEATPDGTPEAPNVPETPAGGPSMADDHPVRFTNIGALRDHIRSGDLGDWYSASTDVSGGFSTPRPTAEERAQIADSKLTGLSKGKRLMVYPNRHALGGGDQYMRHYFVAVPGSMEPLVGAGTRKDALAMANALEGVRDKDGHLFPWDSPDAFALAQKFVGPSGESLSVAMGRALAEHDNKYGQWNLSLQQGAEDANWEAAAADWHAGQEADGFTVATRPWDLEPGDEVVFPITRDFLGGDRATKPNLSENANPMGTVHATITGPGRLLSRGIRAFGSENYAQYPADGTLTMPDGRSEHVHMANIEFGVVRRKPRPAELGDGNNDRTPAPGTHEDQGDVDTTPETGGPHPDEHGTDEPQPRPDHEQGDSDDDTDAQEGADWQDEADDAVNEDGEEENDENGRKKKRRKRPRHRDRDGDGLDGLPGGGGLPLAPLPKVPLAPAGGGSGRAPADGRAKAVADLRDRYRTNPYPRDADHEAFRRELAENPTLGVSADGGVAYWSTDGGRTWQFGHARTALTFGSHDDSQISGTAKDAQRMADTYEAMPDAKGRPFTWNAPLDPGHAAEWRDAQGRNLAQAMRAARDADRLAGQSQTPGAAKAEQAAADAEKATNGAAQAVQDGAMPTWSGGPGQVPDDLTALDDGQLEGLLHVLVQHATDNGWDDIADLERVGDEQDRRSALPLEDQLREAEARRIAAGKPRDDAQDIADATGVMSTREARRDRLARLTAEREAITADYRNNYQQPILDELATVQGLEGNVAKRASIDRAMKAREKQPAEDALAEAEGRPAKTIPGQRLDDPTYLLFEANQATYEKNASDELKDWVREKWGDENARPMSGTAFYNEQIRQRRAQQEAYDEEREAAAADLAQRQGEAGRRFPTLDDLRNHLWDLTWSESPTRDQDPSGFKTHEWARRVKAAQAAADDPSLELSRGGRLAVHEGADGRWHVMAPGSAQALGDADGLDSREQAHALADALEGIEDWRGRPVGWDSDLPPLGDSGFRDADGRRIGAAVEKARYDAPGLPPVPEPLGEAWVRRTRAARDQWAEHGYTWPVWDSAELRPGDEVLALAAVPFRESGGRTPSPFAHPNERDASITSAGKNPRIEYATVRARIGEDGQLHDAQWVREDGPDGVVAEPVPVAWVTREHTVIGRRPRRGELATPQQQTAADVERAATSGDETPVNAPEPIGGQPAQWVRADELQQGDVARLEGTTKGGTPRVASGYVQGVPQEVTVSRRGQRQQALKILVAETPDAASGDRTPVYVPMDAQAARAQQLPQSTPGAAPTGAQLDALQGNLPGQVPTDRDGNGIFPGTVVRDHSGREGIVTEANSSAVAVHWEGQRGSKPTAPTALSVADGGASRPEGWTADGRRIEPGQVAISEDGRPLGVVDQVDGDQVTVTGPDGSSQVDASTLRVSGTGSEQGPAVASLEPTTLRDLHKGDTVMLDDTGHPTPVHVTDVTHNGDRTRVEYADIATGEVGVLENVSSTKVQRALDGSGRPADIAPHEATSQVDDTRVIEAPAPIDPVTGPTTDPDLTPAERDAVDDLDLMDLDDPDAVQASVRLNADLPVTEDQAQALADSLRQHADNGPRGRVARRAADKLDGGQPDGDQRPTPGTAGDVAPGDHVAIPDADGTAEPVAVNDVTAGPGGTRTLDVTDADGNASQHTMATGAAVWHLPDPANSYRVILPSSDDEDGTVTVDPADVEAELESLDADAPSVPASAATPAPAPSTPARPATPASSAPARAAVRIPASRLKRGDVIDAPTGLGAGLHSHRRVRIIAPPQVEGFWRRFTVQDMQTGEVMELSRSAKWVATVHDRDDRKPRTIADLTTERARSVMDAVIDSAITGATPGSIHALRQSIAEQMTPEATRAAEQRVAAAFLAGLEYDGISGPELEYAQKVANDAAKKAREQAVAAALRIVNDIEPLPDETEEDTARRAVDLLRGISSAVDVDRIVNAATSRHTITAINSPRSGGAGSRRGGYGGGSSRGGRGGRNAPLIQLNFGFGSRRAQAETDRAVSDHVTQAVTPALNRIADAATNGTLTTAEADRIAAEAAAALQNGEQAVAGRIAAAVTDATGEEPRPGLWARIWAFIKRIARKVAEWVRSVARKAAEKWRDRDRERLSRIGKGLARRIKSWPEAVGLRSLVADAVQGAEDGADSAEAVARQAADMPEPGRFGQIARRVIGWRRTSTAELEAGRLPEVSDGTRWTADRAADGGPGESAMRHLDTLLGAGDAVDADVLTRMRQAAPELGADPHATVAAARDTERRAVERVAQVTAQARSGNRGAELDLAGAETEARHAAADARRMEEAYNRALREASLAALSDIRPMGPGADTMAVGGPDGDSKEAVKRSLQFLPTDWLSAAEELTVHPDGLTRGYYNVDLGEAALGSEGASVASAPTLDAQALHQLGHHMQHSIPDLAAASEAYHWLRTSTGRIGNRKRNTQVRLADRFPTRGHRADATARDGYWADLLAGMDARDGKSWQLLPVGLESLFSDSWYLDDDLRKFLFGALAVLGRRP